MSHAIRGARCPYQPSPLARQIPCVRGFAPRTGNPRRSMHEGHACGRGLPSQSGTGIHASLTQNPRMSHAEQSQPLAGQLFGKPGGLIQSPAKELPE